MATLHPQQSTDEPWPDRPDGWRHDAGTPEEAFPVPFTMFDGIGLVLWTIVAQVLVGAPAIALGLDLDVPVQALIVTVAIQVATFAGVLGWLAARGALSWRVLGPVRPAWKHVWQGLGLGVVGFFLVFVVAEMFDSAFGPFPQPEQTLLTFDYDGAGVVVLLVAATVVLAPLVEETVFRSIVFQSTRRTLGMFPGLVLSSLLFAFVHLEVLTSPPAVAGLLVLALWLAAVMHRTGSLVTALAAHAAYNTIVVVITLLASSGVLDAPGP